jgi:transcriptional regulator with XRE-family HTH domain
LTLKTQKPKSLKYSKQLNTLGDHIRKRRLDLGLFQRQVAEQIGVTEWTIFNWESNATRPPNRHVPRIIAFLGYNPIVTGSSLAERLKSGRKSLGLSQKRAAAIVGLNESTLAKLERGKSLKPLAKTLGKLAPFIRPES